MLLVRTEAMQINTVFRFFTITGGTILFCFVFKLKIIHCSKGLLQVLNFHLYLCMSVYVHVCVSVCLITYMQVHVRVVPMYSCAFMQRPEDMASCCSSETSVTQFLRQSLSLTQSSSSWAGCSAKSRVCLSPPPQPVPSMCHLVRIFNTSAGHQTQVLVLLRQALTD